MLSKLQAPIIKIKRLLLPLFIILAILSFCQILVTYYSGCPRVGLVQISSNDTAIPIISKTIKLAYERNLKKSIGIPFFKNQQNFNFDERIILEGNKYSEIVDMSNLDEIINKEGLVVHRWQEDPECSNFSIRFAKKNKIRPRALVSYPGSGNHWVRHLIESSTGIFTGNVRPNSRKIESPGDLHKANDGTTIVQKTHHDAYSPVIGLPAYNLAQIRMSELFGYVGILIIRNPFDALLGQWNFEITLNHTGHASEDSFTKKQIVNKWPTNWQLFVKVAVMRWAELIEAWIGKSADLHVVQYEDLERNLEGELLGILQYLKHPIDSRKIKCTLKLNEGFYHRKHDGTNKIKIYRDIGNTSENSTLEEIVLNNIKKVNLFLMERPYSLQLDYNLQR